MLGKKKQMMAGRFLHSNTIYDYRHQDSRGKIGIQDFVEVESGGFDFSEMDRRQGKESKPILADKGGFRRRVNRPAHLPYPGRISRTS
jgi:hypothetical protein